MILSARKRCYVICLLGMLFYFYETLLETSPSTMVTGLMNSFHLNATVLGWLDGAYFFSYAMMQIPAGILLDYLPPRRLFPMATLCCFVGLLLFAFSSRVLAVAILGRLLAGVGGSFGLLGAMYLLSHYWPRRNYLAFAMGLAMMIGLSGGLMQAPMLWLVTHFGWQCLMISLAVGAALFSVVMRRIFPNENAVISVRTNFNTKHLSVLKEKSIWTIAVYGGLMYLPVGVLGSLWGIRYLQAYYPGHSAILLANINALIFLGWIIGSPLWGFISDRLKKRKPILIFCAITAAGCLAIMVYSTLLSILYMSIVMMVLGISSSGSGLTFVLAKELSARETAGTAISFVNMLAILFSIIAMPLFGWMLDLHWQGLMQEGARLYRLSDFQHALWFIGVAIEFSVILPFFIRPTPCQG